MTGAGEATDIAEGYVRPDALEVATSWIYGVVPHARLPRTTVAPLEALERAILPAVATGACHVTFSGGRDSSAVLAVATHVARREGLPDPVPVTAVYPDDPLADERQWQELVVRHLGLRDWVRVELHDENDLLGDVARAGLLQRGLIAPPPLQTDTNLMRHMTRGGALLTGEGGDEVFGRRRITPTTRLLRGVVPRTVRALRSAVTPWAPGPVHRRLMTARITADRWDTWLTPQARAEHIRRLVAGEGSEPLRWDEAVWWVRHRRVARVLDHNHRLVAREHDLTASDPLLDEGFVAALARWGGRWGGATRTDTMAELFGHLLPPALVQRRQKAAFNGAFFNEHTRAFAREWDGSGVDAELVDVDELRRLWLSDVPPGPTSMLLQAAWLATQSAAREPAS